MQGESVSLVLKNLVSISIMMSLSAASFASDAEAESAEGVSVQEVTRHFRDSQQLLLEACKIKSIERALRALNRADESLRGAKKLLSNRAPASAAETRMKSRLMYKLDQDINFLNQLRGDLGMAEIDPFENYIVLRRSLIKDAEQRSNVVRMDHQILLTLESRSYK